VSSHVGLYRKPKARSRLGFRQIPSERSRRAKRNVDGDFTGPTDHIIRGSASPRIGDAMTTAIHLGELVSAITFAITLLVASTPGAKQSSVSFVMAGLNICLGPMTMLSKN
jgi:hypothetical protein